MKNSVLILSRTEPAEVDHLQEKEHETETSNG